MVELQDGFLNDYVEEICLEQLCDQETNLDLHVWRVFVTTV